MNKSKSKITDIIYIALAAALIAICSWISIPLAVPVTLQTFAVFAITGLLGLKRGVLAVLTYIVIGAVGVPVFSGFMSGFGVLLGSTGGYIIGFIFSALIIGFITERLGKKISVLIIAMFISLFVCYLFGTAWFMFVYTQNTGAIELITVLSWCVFPFVLPDIIKIILAATIVERLSKYVK